MNLVSSSHSDLPNDEAGIRAELKRLEAAIAEINQALDKNSEQHRPLTEKEQRLRAELPRLDEYFRTPEYDPDSDDPHEREMAERDFIQFEGFAGTRRDLAHEALRPGDLAGLEEVERLRREVRSLGEKRLPLARQRNALQDQVESLRAHAIIRGFDLPPAASTTRAAAPRRPQARPAIPSVFQPDSEAGTNWMKRASHTQEQAAQILGCSRRTVHNYIKKGLMKMTANKRITTEELRRFLNIPN